MIKKSAGNGLIKLQSPPPIMKRTASIQKNKVKQVPVGLKSSNKQKNKSVEYSNRRRKVSLQIKTKYQISRSHMGFLIQQQKQSDLDQIHSSVALTHYYQSLLSLFALIYSSSQIIASNIFQVKKLRTGLSGLKFVGILFSIYQYVWNQQHFQTLKMMARNVIKMGATQSIYQNKIQFVCRKITLNYNMQRRIQMAFLNTKLDMFWKILLQKFKFNDQIQIIQDMYETAPQKMAYWDFSYFVNTYLADQNFYSVLKQSSKLKKRQSQQQDVLLTHNFTYQFIIIQIFCFHQEQMDRQEQDRSDLKNSCNVI